jgi:hypothetical protein
VRYPDEISSYAELREARRKVGVQVWLARQELDDTASDALSWSNLLSIVLPSSGSLLDRLIDRLLRRK